MLMSVGGYGGFSASKETLVFRLVSDDHLFVGAARSRLDHFERQGQPSRVGMKERMRVVVRSIKLWAHI